VPPTGEPGISDNYIGLVRKRKDEKSYNTPDVRGWVTFIPNTMCNLADRGAAGCAATQSKCS